MMKKRFTNLKLILLVSAFILINIIYAGSAFAVTQNTTNNTQASQITPQTSNLTQITNQNINSNTSISNQTNAANFSSIYGYYINPNLTPVNTMDPITLKKQGITDVFVLTKNDNPNDTLAPFLNKFSGTGINVYAWVESFKDPNGNWFYPEDNLTLLNQIINNITSIAANYNVDGILLDYLRYPGNAYMYPNATVEVDSFAQTIRNNIDNINNLNIPGKPHILLSAALMPEGVVNDYYYGQNYTQLSNILDFLSPMIYKGNYREPTSWIGTTTAYIKSQAKETPVVTILQTYNSDADPTPLTSNQLNYDIKTSLDNGSYGYSLFRYGLIASDWTGYNASNIDTPPNETSTDPVNGSVNVVNNKVIKITFSEPITAGSAYSQITVKNSAGASKQMSASITGDDLNLTPVYNYLTGYKYTIFIPANAVKDSVGNGLATDYTSSFTIAATVPSVNSTDPVNDSVNVPNTKVITITFSEPITAGSAYNSITVKNSGGAVKMMDANINGSVLTLTPVYNYLIGYKYTIYIPANAVKDSTGNGLAADYTSSFTIVTKTPSVTIIDPTNNAVNVPNTKTIKITFSEPITPGSDYNSITVKNSAGASKQMTASISGDVLTLMPVYNYLTGYKYTIFIPANAVKDSAGNGLAADYTSSFTIATIIPSVNGTDPVNGAVNVSNTKVIKITFNEPITAGSAYNNIKVINSAGAVKMMNSNINGSVLTLTPVSNYLTGYGYTIYIPANAVKDSAGNGLAADYISSFIITTT
jgi:methionine-rich copper-binding protein CopC